MNKKNTRNDLQETLDRLKTDPALNEGDARRIAAEVPLGEGLRRVAGAAMEEHLELPELTRLAAEYRRSDGEKDVPEHLAACPICLDLFQALLDGVPSVSRQTTERFENTPDSPRRLIRLKWLSSWTFVLRAAAIVAILLSAGVLLKPLFAAKVSVTMSQGVFTMANGETVAEGRAIPHRQQFTMSQGSALALDDGGTSVRAEAASKLSFSQSMRGDSLFVVKRGDVWVSAAKQKPGSAIRIQTPLGDIRVVGTQFRVTLDHEQVVVHEMRPEQPESTQYDDKITAVTVEVKEGTVVLRNRYEEVAVSAGQTAVMRQDQPWIEIRWR